MRQDESEIHGTLPRLRRAGDNGRGDRFQSGGRFRDGASHLSQERTGPAPRYRAVRRKTDRSGDRRARAGPRRRDRPRLSDPDRRRPGNREIDAPSSDGDLPRRESDRPLRFRRRIRTPDQNARRTDSRVSAEVPRSFRTSPAVHGNQPGRDFNRRRRAETGIPDCRLDPDDPAFGAGIDRRIADSGPRMHRKIARTGENERADRLRHRSRYQGGPDRRSARPGTYRRHCPVPGRRPLSDAAAAAFGQEPLWRDIGGRRL